MKRVLNGPVLLFLSLLPLIAGSLSAQSSDQDVVPAPDSLSFFTPVEDGFTLSPLQREYLDEAVLWSWVSIGAFGANVLGFTITMSTDSNVGTLLTMFSVGFWTASNFFNAVAHRKLIREIDDSGSSSPKPLPAGLSAIVAGALGVGTLSAISLSFGEPGGPAAIVAYIGMALSTVAGGYGIYKTYEYARAGGVAIDFF